ncbi:MAG TPA: hypothetical protein VFV50_08680 [Bdellovibrionales bacterium]|nr:hypothetical protein [Bdellovibrionales bacterium]
MKRLIFLAASFCVLLSLSARADDVVLAIGQASAAEAQDLQNFFKTTAPGSAVLQVPQIELVPAVLPANANVVSIVFVGDGLQQAIDGSTFQGKAGQRAAFTLTKIVPVERLSNNILAYIWSCTAPCKEGKRLDFREIFESAYLTLLRAARPEQNLTLVTQYQAAAQAPGRTSNTISFLISSTLSTASRLRDFAGHNASRAGGWSKRTLYSLRYRHVPYAVGINLALVTVNVTADAPAIIPVTAAAIGFYIGLKWILPERFERMITPEFIRNPLGFFRRGGGAASRCGGAAGPV